MKARASAAERLARRLALGTLVGVAAWLASGRAHTERPPRAAEVNTAAAAPAPPPRARPAAAEGGDARRPAIDYERVRVRLANRPQQLHRFRLRVAEVRGEIVDLGFRTPVSGGLEAFTLAVNGGYWEWHLGQRRAIGLVVSHGRQLSPLRKKLDGGVLIVDRSEARIVRSRGAQLTASTQLAVQCRPRLVEAGEPIAGLNASARAARTAVCTRDRGRTLDVVLSDPGELGPTLAGLAHWLSEDGCEAALNLDGGPSTAAAYRQHGKLLSLGAGVGLPYALRFVPK